MKTWLITGASTGLGRGIAEAALAHGDRAVITARDPRKLFDLRNAYGDRVLPLSLEVTDQRQRHEAVARTVDAFGGIDVLVNNAGRGHFGAVEDSMEEDVRLLFETNFFGPVGMIREALPYMRQAGTGLIVNTSSIGVMFENGTGNAYYTASKAALEMLSNVLGNEVAPLGLRVMILEPGAFRTEFRVSAIQHADSQIADYADTAGASRKYLNDNPHNQPGDPAKAGEAVYLAASLGEPPHVLVLGKGMIDAASKTLDGRKAEIARWRDISESTDY
ncbi:SDR family NAD(P)-dependent oxidoreductase [Olsenella sp. Marseille-P4559]|uniref:SDR family NAD(P)-dependent oxidoreductase n=1 Tax=Olsenella sp. Marseille-P4559 TaxID=2364795 RepID=UPI00103055CE|nr:SDR family NAD(P)-dependent oxidoreductase [Olsenella sp. Marseille-P4559]